MKTRADVRNRSTFLDISESNHALPPPCKVSHFEGFLYGCDVGICIIRSIDISHQSRDHSYGDNSKVVSDRFLTQACNVGLHLSNTKCLREILTLANVLCFSEGCLMLIAAERLLLRLRGVFSGMMTVLEFTCRFVECSVSGTKGSVQVKQQLLSRCK